MKKVAYSAVALTLVCANGSVTRAQELMEDMTVTANRAATSLDRIGGSVTVITEEKIENRQATKLEDILKNTPGVTLLRYGAPGASTLINMRGTEANHTTVMIDGQRMNFQDVSSYTFDYDSTTTDNIERIEILRGPSAGQWGGDTIGGVINIVTKKGKGPMKVTTMAEGGSFGTHRESVSALGGGDRYDYNFGWSNFLTDGWSTASKVRGYGTEPDGMENQTAFIKLGVSPTENSEVEVRYSHTDFESHSDGTGTVTGTTRDTHILKFKHVDSGHVKAQVALFDGFWTPSISGAIIHSDQWIKGSQTASTGCTNGAVNGSPSLCTAYDSWSENYGFANNLKFNQDNTTTLGAESFKDSYWQKQYQNKGTVTADRVYWTHSGYLQHQTRLFDVLDLLGGYRGGKHDTFGLYSTYFGTAAWHLPTATTLKGSFGTTFKPPSLYQVYYPSQASNTSLEPEKGRSWDLGFEQKLLGNTAKIGATYFRNDISNRIESVSNAVGTLSQYRNISKSTTYGVETFINYQVWDDQDGSLTVSPNYTYTMAYKRGINEDLTRRPRHAVGGDVTWKFLEKKAKLNLATTFRSDYQETRTTTIPNRYDARTGAYAQFDLAGSYDVTDTLQVFGRMENIFDRYHEEATGYAATGGRAFYAGVKVAFWPTKLLGDGGR